MYRSIDICSFSFYQCFCLDQCCFWFDQCCFSFDQSVFLFGPMLFLFGPNINHICKTYCVSIPWMWAIVFYPWTGSWKTPVAVVMSLVVVAIICVGIFVYLKKTNKLWVYTHLHTCMYIHIPTTHTHRHMCTFTSLLISVQTCACSHNISIQ